MKQTLKFPNGFLWGSATSAYQIEGNNKNADWWQWENSIARISSLNAREKDPEAYKSGLACDSYNRYDEDFDLAVKLGHNAHRLGIEWSRIQPTEAEFDENELDHYERVFRAAKARGLTLFVTLHHFTCPVWFMEKGGFTRRSNIKYFISYAEAIAKRLGEYVDFWLTMNEPEVYSTYPYLIGVFPPQQKSFRVFYRVIRNLILAHNLSSARLKLLTGKPVSMAFHLSDIQSESFFGNFTRLLMNYIANEYIIRRVIHHCDFIGTNYYNHHHVGFFGLRKSSHSHHQVSDMGWGIHPEGLERVLLNLKKYNKPVYILENGLADATDTKRERFIKDHLYFVHKAIEKGVDVKSYLYWSLLDNFEWQHGFWPRFGLVAIDRSNDLSRNIRPSAEKFAEICKSNILEYEVEEQTIK